MQSLLTTLISKLGIPRLARGILGDRARFVVGFHGVAKQRYVDIPRSIQPSMAVEELRTILEWIGARFDFLTPDELLDGQKPGVLVTFDDGLASVYEQALSALEEMGVPAIYFVTLQHVLESENWLSFNRAFAEQHWPSVAAVPREIGHEFYDGLTRGQVAACAKHDLITIGAHTMTHPRLTTCDDDQLREELVRSRQLLEEIAGEPVSLFAYPYGDYDRRVAEAAEAAGYRAAFAVRPIDVGMPLFEIPRVDLYWTDPAYLDVKLSGLLWRPVSI